MLTKSENINLSEIRDPETELRVYLVFRRDLTFTREQIIQISAQATWKTIKNCNLQNAEKVTDYSENNQPKIALGVKSQSKLERVVQELNSSNIPYAVISDNDCTMQAVSFGPVQRCELNPHLRGLQLLSDSFQTQQDDCVKKDIDQNQLNIWIAVRKDAEIPSGKLCAQAGHGCWSVLEAALKDNKDLVDIWDQQCNVQTFEIKDQTCMDNTFKSVKDIGLTASFIVDAGRTVFNKPTPTVVGIGPCTYDQLPLEVQNSINSVENYSLKL